MLAPARSAHCRTPARSRRTTASPPRAEGQGRGGEVEESFGHVHGPDRHQGRGGEQSEEKPGKQEGRKPRPSPGQNGGGAEGGQGGQRPHDEPGAPRDEGLQDIVGVGRKGCHQEDEITADRRHTSGQSFRKPVLDDRPCHRSQDEVPEGKRAERNAPDGQEAQPDDPHRLLRLGGARRAPTRAARRGGRWRAPWTGTPPPPRPSFPASTGSGCSLHACGSRRQGRRRASRSRRCGRTPMPPTRYGWDAGRRRARRAKPRWGCRGCGVPPRRGRARRPDGRRRSSRDRPSGSRRTAGSRPPGSASPRAGSSRSGAPRGSSPRREAGRGIPAPGESLRGGSAGRPRRDRSRARRRTPARRAGRESALDVGRRAASGYVAARPMPVKSSRPGPAETRTGEGQSPLPRVCVKVVTAG